MNARENKDMQFYFSFSKGYHISADFEQWKKYARTPKKKSVQETVYFNDAWLNE